MRKIVLLTAFICILFASELAQKATAECENGNTLSCAALGEIYLSALEGQSVDYAKAFKFNQKACDGGNLVSCINLGLLYANGRGVNENFAMAAELFDKACKGGEMFACSNLGAMYLDGVGVEEDEKKGISYLKKACDKNDIDGCLNLAYFYEETDDLREAVKFYKKSCEIGKNKNTKQAWKEACDKQNLK